MDSDPISTRHVFAFFSLSREIRDEIYRYLWDDTFICFCYPGLTVGATYDHISLSPRLSQVSERDSSGLPCWLLSTKQMFKEGLTEFYLGAEFFPIPMDGVKGHFFSQILSLDRARRINFSKVSPARLSLGVRNTFNREKRFCEIRLDEKAIFRRAIQYLPRSPHVLQEINMTVSWRQYRRVLEPLADDIRSQLTFLEKLPRTLARIVFVLQTSSHPERGRRRFLDAIKDELRRIARPMVRGPGELCTETEGQMKDGGVEWRCEVTSLMYRRAAAYTVL
ncbi:hypothetical protein K505DRAFT_335149 [Melanomma pulvis-pyrius CBS 109.77]|uniref:Uncharacterized protein n=1 Tax=Melanomma pulvis-pyrius CBS 109.77 TaxID=1314802 RepID=A0A6A6XJS2_9PLEO|nr:hypothetical protein K505DRAFT_335149 [Melanomma pulvis-pyrius CBS 109.77]